MIDGDIYVYMYIHMSWKHLSSWYTYMCIYICNTDTCVYIYAVEYTYICGYITYVLHIVFYISVYIQLKVHACMYECMHVCIYACMHVHMYACMNVCMYACMHVCIYLCMYVCVYVSML